MKESKKTKEQMRRQRKLPKETHAQTPNYPQDAEERLRPAAQQPDNTSPDKSSPKQPNNSLNHQDFPTYTKSTPQAHHLSSAKTRNAHPANKCPCSFSLGQATS